MKTFARVLALLAVAASGLLYMGIRCAYRPARGKLWILRLLAKAVTPCHSA